MYRSHWNDLLVERSKPWWIEDATDPRLVEYLKADTNLWRCFVDGVDFADQQLGCVRGTVIDLGAGVCWTTALLSRYPGVERLVAVDYSEHRLFRIAPVVFTQLQAKEERIERRCDSILPLTFSDECADLVVFCQALYMIEQPVDMLREVRRVLRPGGAVMIACENVEGAESPLRHLLHNAADVLRRSPREWPAVITGRLPDASGRRCYLDRDYERFVGRAGFSFIRQRLEYPVFRDSPVPAINYFGVKNK